MAVINLDRFKTEMNQLTTIRTSGKVVQVVGLTVEAVGLDCQIGEVCEIRSNTSQAILAEVVGFRNRITLLMPLGNMEGIQPDSSVYPIGTVFQAPVGERLLGRVLDGIGEPIDGLGKLEDGLKRPIFNYAPHPLERKVIE